MEPVIADLDARAVRALGAPRAWSAAPRDENCIADQVDFPELDVRQRLTVPTGCGVAEIVVREGSDLVGKAIESTGLRDHDITELTLTRGATVIPNPRASRELEPGDRLLWFGKLESMRNLVPERRRRMARPAVQPLPEDAHPNPMRDGISVIAPGRARADAGPDGRGAPVSGVVCLPAAAGRPGERHPQ